MLTFGHLMLVNITPSRKEWNHDSYPTIPLGNTNLNQAKKCVHIRDFLDNLQFHALTGKKKKKKKEFHLRVLPIEGDMTIVLFGR